MGTDIYVSTLTADLEQQFIDAVGQSRKLHAPWVSPPSTAQEFQGYLARVQEPSGAAFVIWEWCSDGFAGVVQITNILMDPFRSAHIDFFAFSGFEGKGLMKEGLAHVVKQVFRTSKLHRLEANIQPENKAAIALVKSCGFKLEGLSPAFMKVGGRWRDHERWALLSA
ncbi:MULTISPECIES: GNAT family N-acetyltransferase [Delftia]|uniref:Ribosomal-protein-alanine N-acetyltransferase n=1 Tax=Delftia lacustris TaxID=558537 RepID=A0A1H3JAS5_9BURK|nr:MULTISPECIES: GNAT family protein [Delftia]SDY37051.1 ribosomal-protein-alanine N-acetyltransferase [Delftia lacustris]